MDRRAGEPVLNPAISSYAPVQKGIHPPFTHHCPDGPELLPREPELGATHERPSGSGNPPFGRGQAVCMMQFYRQAR